MNNLLNLVAIAIAVNRAGRAFARARAHCARMEEILAEGKA